MAKSVPALVTPDVVKWARELDDLSVDEVSGKLKVKTVKIAAWENGSDKPTLNQAKKLAKICRVPFVYFYLPDIPRRTKRLNKVDYRTFIMNTNYISMSRELRWLIRDIEERRDVILDLYTTEEKSPVKFNFYERNGVSEQQIGKIIRSLLDLKIEVQKSFRKPETALHYCVDKLESMNFLIFQAAKIDPSEMRGLSVAYDILPIITLNRKDESSARLFTLFHELAHIITRNSGICNETTSSSNSQNSEEVFCNRVAGLALVPDDDLKFSKSTQHIRKFGIDDSVIMSLARDFAVSKEVIIHRLWDINIISKYQYLERLQRYTDEYLAYKKRKRDKKGFLPPALDKGTQIGKLYARTVMSAYHNEKISLHEASGYLLDLGAQHFNKLERWCF